MYRVRFGLDWQFVAAARARGHLLQPRLDALPMRDVLAFARHAEELLARTDFHKTDRARRLVMRVKLDRVGGQLDAARPQQIQNVGWHPGVGLCLGFVEVDPDLAAKGRYRRLEVIEGDAIQRLPFRRRCAVRTEYFEILRKRCSQDLLGREFWVWVYRTPCARKKNPPGWGVVIMMDACVRRKHGA